MSAGSMYPSLSGIQALRRSEIYQNAWSQSGKSVDLVGHRQCLPVEIFLKLSGPAIGF